MLMVGVVVGEGWKTSSSSGMATGTETIGGSGSGVRVGTIASRRCIEATS